MRLNLITMAAWLAALVWLVLHRHEIEWTGVKLAGAAIAGIASALLLIARLQLGGSFSVGAKARTLVTTGLYARIRNPIYVLGAIFIVGVAMVVGRWEFALLLLIVTPMQVYRARQEERVLHLAFGEEYERYKAGTWF